MSETPEVSEDIGKYKRLNKAFLSVFGAPNHRSVDQQLVFDELESFSGFENPSFGGSLNPLFDSHLAAKLDGGRALFIAIRKRIKKGLDSPDTKQKRKTIKE
jgi:hypothetical protein